MRRYKKKKNEGLGEYIDRVLVKNGWRRETFSKKEEENTYYQAERDGEWGVYTITIHAVTEKTQLGDLWEDYGVQDVTVKFYSKRDWWDTFCGYNERDCLDFARVASSVEDELLDAGIPFERRYFGHINGKGNKKRRNRKIWQELNVEEISAKDYAEMAKGEG